MSNQPQCQPTSVSTNAAKVRQAKIIQENCFHEKKVVNQFFYQDFEMFQFFQ